MQSTELYVLEIIRIATWTILILFLVGFFTKTPLYFIEFTLFIKVIMALYLVYRFNPYFDTKQPFTLLDRQICYSSGIFILFIAFTDYVTYYMYQIRSVIIPFTNPIVTAIKGSELYTSVFGQDTGDTGDTKDMGDTR